MRLLRYLIFTIMLTAVAAPNAVAAEDALFYGKWGLNIAQLQELIAQEPLLQGTLVDVEFIQYDIILEGCQGGIIYQFDHDRLYAVSISIYVYVETAQGLALIQTFTERLRAMLPSDTEPQKNITQFDETSQIMHTGQYFEAANTTAFIFAKIWPEEESRQVIIMEFMAADHPAARRLPLTFKDLFSR